MNRSLRSADGPGDSPPPGLPGNGEDPQRVRDLTEQVSMLREQVAELDGQVAVLISQSAHVARGWRFANAIVFLGVLALTYVASLSDMAPGLVGDVKDTVGVADSLPVSFESVLHFTGWMLAMIFAGLAVRSFPILFATAVTLVVAGISVEVLQDTITDTRGQEWRDVQANSLGIALGFLIVLATRIAVKVTAPRSA